MDSLSNLWYNLPISYKKEDYYDKDDSRSKWYDVWNV